jgi:DME family drug/metabolite transporter
VYPLAFYSSMHLAGVAIGTVVSLGSAPIVSGLLEMVLERRRPSTWWVLAAVLGIGGSAVLCVAKMHEAPADLVRTTAGVGLGLIAGATYALYSWSAHRLMRSGVGRAAAMGSIFGLGGLVLMPVLAVTGAPLLASTQAFAVGAYMALVPMFLGYLAFGYGLTRVSASTATTLTLTEPAVAAVLAVTIVGERLPLIGWAGIAAICVSLLVLAVAPATQAAIGGTGAQATPRPSQGRRTTGGTTTSASGRRRTGTR